MRVKIVGGLRDTCTATGKNYSQEDGDIITVADETGARWCAYGWATDADGVVPTGERIPGARALDVQSHKSGVKNG